MCERSGGPWLELADNALRLLAFAEVAVAYNWVAPKLVEKPDVKIVKYIDQWRASHPLFG